MDWEMQGFLNEDEPVEIEVIDMFLVDFFEREFVDVGGEI
jgi:hypothetical protein